MSIKITNFIPHYPPAIGFGGAAKRTAHQNQMLVKYGFSIRVVTSDILDPLGRKRLFGVFNESNGITCVRYRHLVGGFGYSVTPSIIRELAEEKPDLVLSTLLWNFQTDYGVIHSRLRGVPSVLEPCGSGPLHHGNIRMKRIHYRLTLGRMIRLYDLVLAQTFLEKSDLVKMGVSKNRIFVNRPGIDIDRFKHGKTDFFARRWNVDSPNILKIVYVGRLAPEKGVDWLIKSFAALLRHTPNAPVMLFIVGKRTAYSQELTSLVRLLSVDRKVIFVDHVRQAEIPDVYHSSDVIVIPSYRENLPQVVLEAGMSKAVVIASNVGGIPEVIRDGETGYLVDPSRDWTLGRCLKRIIDSKSTGAVDVGHNLRELVATSYSHKDSTRELVKVLQGVAEGA